MSVSFQIYLENITIRTISHGLTHKRVLSSVTWFSILLGKAGNSAAVYSYIALPNCCKY